MDFECYVYTHTLQRETSHRDAFSIKLNYSELFLVGHTEDVRERTKSVDSEIICFSDGNGWYLSDFKVALLISIGMLDLFILFFCISEAFKQKNGRKFETFPCVLDRSVTSKRIEEFFTRVKFIFISP